MYNDYETGNISLRKIVYGFVSVLVFFITLYVSLSIYYKFGVSVVSFLSISAFLASSFCLYLKRFRFLYLVVYLFFFVVWLFWYINIQPSNDKNWQKDVSVLAYATIDKNLIKFYNIRNFKYTTEDRYIVSYYDETFDLDKLSGIDFIATYWMGPSIAHTFLSFSFSDDKHLAISIEVRKEVGESYSMLRGFFKQNEIYYVVADERDLIGLRTNIRKNPIEHVYLYQIKANLDEERRVFLNYVKKINLLKTNPEFYNTLTTNCTTSIWKNVTDKKLTWEMLVSGYSAHYLYENGLLKTYGLSFKELKKRSYINPLVSGKPIDEFYSKNIRKRD